jgi:hypothetical protein
MFSEFFKRNGCVGINGNQGVKINLVGGKSSNPKTKTKARPNMIKFKKIQKSSKGRHFSIHTPSKFVITCLAMSQLVSITFGMRKR